MPRPIRRTLPAVVAAGALVTGSLVAATAPAWPAPSGGTTLTAGQEQALRAGVQVAPKESVTGRQAPSSSPNPYLANLPDMTKADYSGWRQSLATRAKDRAGSSALARAKRAAARVLPLPLVHVEQEPADAVGANDRQADAELAAGFGTGAGDNPRVRLRGALATPAAGARDLAPVPEDNGAIPLAGNTGLTGPGTVRSTGRLGDGPHGPGGTGRNDFDFYALSASAGQTLRIEISAPSTDPVVAVYDRAGTLLGADDDSGPGLDSLLTMELPRDGSYYVLVGGYAAGGFLPANPNDSGSGRGGAQTGRYGVLISTRLVDADHYAVQLEKGDVLGATATGAAGELRVYRPDGTQMVGASTGDDATALYPVESPLPGGGNQALAYVAEESGTYALRVQGTPGRYGATVEAYRPGAERGSTAPVQTVFLDFDGARVNTAIWGGPGVRTLCPLSEFLTRWGLTAAEEGRLIDQITAEVEENIHQDMVERGLNDAVEVRVLNSADHEDVYGQENVSRVIVGGTTAQAGISTIGIAQFIDPGNYAREDNALVLLDTLSSPTGPASLNTHMTAASNRVDFVSQALGNVIAHEIGHLVGNYHTHNLNSQVDLMDRGGACFCKFYGVGRDGVGGTADDADVDFSEDIYAPVEGFTGREDTLNVAAWAYGRPGGQPQP